MKTVRAGEKTAAARDTACATASRSSKDLGYTALLQLREVTAQEEVVAVVWMGGKTNWACGECGMVGVYQHCGEAHLHRYVAEFDFRYNRRTALWVTDAERAEDAIRGAAGKRLTYQQTDDAPNA